MTLQDRMSAVSKIGKTFGHVAPSRTTDQKVRISSCVGCWIVKKQKQALLQTRQNQLDIASNRAQIIFRICKISWHLVPFVTSTSVQCFTCILKPQTTLSTSLWDLYLQVPSLEQSFQQDILQEIWASLWCNQNYLVLGALWSRCSVIWCLWWW